MRRGTRTRFTCMPAALTTAPRSERLQLVTRVDTPVMCSHVGGQQTPRHLSRGMRRCHCQARPCTCASASVSTLCLKQVTRFTCAVHRRNGADQLMLLAGNHTGKVAMFRVMLTEREGSPNIELDPSGDLPWWICDATPWYNNALGLHSFMRGTRDSTHAASVNLVADKKMSVAAQPPLSRTYGNALTRDL